MFSKHVHLIFKPATGSKSNSGPKVLKEADVIIFRDALQENVFKKRKKKVTNHITNTGTKVEPVHQNNAPSN